MLIDIKKIGINGEGIGYFKKVPVFVERALIDETVDVTIVENNKNYKVAKLNKIIKKSIDRIEPICPNYEKCNGCSLMHTTYQNQLKIKKELVQEALLKYADIEVDIDVNESNNQIEYRNCLKLPFIENNGKLVLGVYEANSNYICPINKCFIHTKLLEELKDEVLAVLNNHNCHCYDRKNKRGFRYLVLREIGNRGHMCLITGEDKLNKELVDDLSKITKIVSIYQCINTGKISNNIFTNKMIHLSGGKHLVFKIDDLKFNLSIKSFFQLNTYQAKKLYHYVINLLDDNNDLIVEAYSGIGVMSLLAKDKAKKIVGIEYVKDAVINGNVNANLNHINNVIFECGDASLILLNNFKKQKIDTLIVDPPRSGLDDKMIDAILKNHIKKIIYVSCNPSTLAKNIDALSKQYELQSISGFDMFPQTAHVECVVSMQRK